MRERKEGRDSAASRTRGNSGGRRGEERGVGETRSKDRARGGRGEGGRARESRHALSKGRACGVVRLPLSTTQPKKRIDIGDLRPVFT